MKTDTIAAIATAMSNSGIGIIRISGSEAFVIIDKIFKFKKSNKKIQHVKSHTIHYGYIYDGNERVDEVLVMVMKGPNSYTAEDIIEIDCHGGVLVVKKILDIVLKYGARPAEPGEFTKRAFLNGRIDLSQAEAVIDVINAKNQFALKSSIYQLTGSVSEKIENLRDQIIYEIAFIESALDDPEHISLDGYDLKLSRVIDGILIELEKLLNTVSNGKVMKEGIKTVILGKPNAGKSSLMNLLLGQERAIVTDIAGTTRDILEEQINLQGINLNVIDTAGIRKTEDIVEKIGVSKAKEAAQDADLIIYVADGSCEIDNNDKEILEFIQDKKAIILLNKIDLLNLINEKELELLGKKKVIPISVKNNTGIELLKEAIKKMFYVGEINFNDELYITNSRHIAALEQSDISLRLVKQSIVDNMPEDFYSIDLINAYEQLGFIIGKALEDDLVNQIFSKFCMGK